MLGDENVQEVILNGHSGILDHAVLFEIDQ